MSREDWPPTVCCLRLAPCFLKNSCRTRSATLGAIVPPLPFEEDDVLLDANCCCLDSDGSGSSRWKNCERLASNGDGVGRFRMGADGPTEVSMPFAPTVSAAKRSSACRFRVLLPTALGVKGSLREDLGFSCGRGRFTGLPFGPGHGLQPSWVSL